MGFAGMSRTHHPGANLYVTHRIEAAPLERRQIGQPLNVVHRGVHALKAEANVTGEREMDERGRGSVGAGTVAD